MPILPIWEIFEIEGVAAARGIDEVCSFPGLITLGVEFMGVAAFIPAIFGTPILGIATFWIVVLGLAALDSVGS
ncbi:MAG: hypothetical protein JOZ57_18410 [Abitibacteriaceae bacterium]|nr:hypothetical protein [Abditibacteriaceae bacterium]